MNYKYTNFTNDVLVMRRQSGQPVYKELSYRIVGVLYEADNRLGGGLQEKYYQKAVASLLAEKGIPFREQVPYNISLDKKCIGRYFLDFLIDEKIVLEIKKGHHFSRRNLEQVKGYLHITEKKLAILANFTPQGVRFMRVLNLY
jgi:GxxExxY protein